MAAIVRSSRSTTFHGGSGTVNRGDARTGDILLAFQAADSGGHSVLDLGGGWDLIEAYPGGTWPGDPAGWAGIKVWQKVCVEGEPSSYSASQGSNADGVYHVLAVTGGVSTSIVTRDSGGSTAPGADPVAASGLALRMVAGLPTATGGGASITWTAPAGTTLLAQAQSTQWMSAAVASQPIVSTANVGAATFTGSNVVASGAITVLIESAELPTPEPPPSQPYAPGAGSSLYRYVFTRLLDRTYLGDLDLVGVSFDKRILQAGTFSATIPVPNRRIGDQVAEIIPRDETELGIGPGVITCQIYREGEPWGEYWITSAQPSRSGRGTPAIALRGSTLDAYLSRVEIQDDVAFVATDQIEIARGLLNHLLSQSDANIGLALESGTSGVLRDRTYLDSEGGTYGQRLIELAQVDDGFEWSINLELVGGSLVRRWVWGYPTLGTLDPPPHLFADGRNGGDILEWGEEIDALRGATRWRARGTTASTDASTSSVPIVSTVHAATAHLAAGWPRLDRTLSYSTVTEQATLEDYAAFWAQRAGGALRVDQVAVALGRQPSLTPNNLGDAGRFYFDNEWHRGVWKTRRIIGIGVTPTSRSDGIEQARLVLEGSEVPGA